MAKKTISGVIGYVGTEASNYIKQINDGSTTHDIAVQSGITFFQGNNGDGVVWDGKQALEVVIPTLADIVSNPVVFVGTVGSDGNITWATGKGPNAQTGYLVYIQANCTFGGQTCEAGDMAVYDGSAWRVIQGENQVAIVPAASEGNADVLLTGTLASVLTVEGTTLRLAIDYADVYSKLGVTKNTSDIELPVQNAKVTVAATYIGLSKAADSTVTVATSAKSINLPSVLEDGTVNISESVLEASNFTFTSGSFPTISLNGSDINVNASTDISVTGTFLTSVSAIGGVSFVNGNQSQHDLAYATGLTAASGKSFVSGVHAYTAEDEGKTAAFEIPGAVTVTGLSTFVSGLGEAASTGDVVSSVVVGDVTVDANGTDFVSGLSGEGSTVLTSVSFGTVEQDSTAKWFYTGLTEGSDVVTDVTVGAVTFVDGNNTAGQTASAIISASVSDHVLSFSVDSFMKPVSISQANSTISKKGFSTGGVKLSGYGSTSDTFTFAGISQAATQISYRSILTGDINVSLGSATKYFLDKEEEHAYDVVLGYSNLSLTDATVSTGSPELTNKAITVTIPSNTVAVGLNDGTLPTFNVAAATGKLTAALSSTALTTSEVSWLAVASDAQTITIPGAYTLGTVASDVEGAVTVASASQYSVTNGTVTIASNAFVTDVYVNDSAVAPKSNA